VLVDDAPASLLMLGYDDFQSGAGLTAGINAGPHLVYRMMFRGGIRVNMQSATATTIWTSHAWCIFDDDADDQVDVNIFSASSNVFANHQIFRWSARPMVFSEIPVAQLGGADSLVRNIPINFDIKFKRPHKLHVDHAIYMVSEFSDDLTTVANSASLEGIFRCVVKPAFSR